MGIVLSYAFAHIIEAVILWMSMSQMYEHRYKKWVTGLIIMIGHAIMFMVFLIGNIYSVTIINNLIYVLLIALLYKVQKKVAVFWAILYNAMMALSELIIFYFAQYVVGIRNVKNQYTLIILVVVCSCKILYYLFSQIMVIIKNKCISVSYANIDISMILLVVILISSLMVFMTFYIIGLKWDLEKKETIWMISSMIVLVISDILVLWVNIRINERNVENQRIKVELEKERADAEYYKLEHEKNESFEILRHDIKNHLNAILNMEYNDSVKQYISYLVDEYSVSNRTTFSNSNVLNGLISQYMNKCNENGIDIMVDIRPDTVEYLVTTDIVALFGNILSNAYEAAQKCNKADKPYIELIVKRNGNVIVIKEVNSCCEAPAKRKGEFKSSKIPDGKKHGYGMKSINRVVEKYNGTHAESYDYIKKEFNISVLLIIKTEN